MKLLGICLGVVIGIYVSAEHPEIAVQIFDSAVVFANWVIASAKSLIEGR